jgi:hypothetical protein
MKKYVKPRLHKTVLPGNAACVFCRVTCGTRGGFHNYEVYPCKARFQAVYGLRRRQGVDHV